MPLQRAVERDALADQACAVIDQQPRSSSGPSSRAVGTSSTPSLIAARATAIASMLWTCLAALDRRARRPSQRRHSNHALAATDEEPLGRARYVTAVLE